MLQIHGIFNLVATLYNTKLLQPKIPYGTIYNGIAISKAL